MKVSSNSIGISKGDFEHLIIDGNSTDGSFEHAQMLSKQSSTRLKKQSSKYLYGAFNDGINASKGKYIIFLYCGDVININKVFNLINKFENFDLIAASCSQKINNKIITYLRSDRQKLSVDSMSILHSSLIISREKYYAVGGFDTRLKISSDVDCVLKIIKISKKIKYVDDVIVYMEEYALSKTHYFKKLKEHSIIKFRHGGLFKALVHIPKKLILDYIIVPLKLTVKNNI